MRVTKSVKLNKIFSKIRQICQSIKKQSNKIRQIIFIGLLLLMIWFIYQISPRIAQVIQDWAHYLYELDSIYITRFIEILLVVSFIAPFGITNNKGGEK